MSTTQQLSEPIDGRTARAVRTRDALVDATIALVEEGDPRPTAPRIAERAGVSVRSVFQHFDDLETLFAAVGSRVVERLAELIQPIDLDAPLAQRGGAFVRQRCRVNEAISPINRAAVLHLPTSEVIARQFRAGHSFVSAHLAEVFAPEMVIAADQAPALATTLITVCSWSTWNVLRSLEDQSVDQATASVVSMVQVALGGGGSAVELAVELP